MKNENKNREPLSNAFFLERNVIKIFGEINDATADVVISSLLYLDFMFKSEKVPREKREISIWINSPGGSVTAGMAIYDAMNYVDCDIRTLCVGMAASMGAFLLSSGTRGKREALPNSDIMIHQPLGGTQGQASDILLYADHIRKTREKLNYILARNSDRPIEEIARDTDRDNTMSAEEAVRYGLIDCVRESYPKAFAPVITAGIDKSA